ncbi:MAG: hypothetical protein HPY59_05895 [Anaerolineae bacterium]|nr:hypothetical protein [Anaerolineae bacterium]
MRPIQKSWLLRILTLITVTLAVAGCVRVQKLKPGAEQAEFFHPPTLVPTALPPTPTLAVSSGTAQEIKCLNSLSFISDVTIPDGTVVKAGSSMDKRWEIKNTGTCNWGEGYTLRLISGSEMGVEEEQALIPARSGSQTVVRIVFTAPSETGLHRSAWQAFDPDGQPFGDPFFIEIEVEAASPILTPSPP